MPADPLLAFRGWLRTQALPLDVLPSRITSGQPAKGGDPSITVYRVGGGDDPGGVPLDNPLVQIDVASQSEAVTAEHAAALKALLRSIQGRVMLSPAVACWGASIVSDVQIVDGDRRVVRSVTVELMTGDV